MESKRKVIIHSIVCVGLLCVIWGGYFLANREIDIDRHREITLYEDDFSWVYQVDSVKKEGKNVVLQGFAFELDKDMTEGTYEIVLQNVESGEKYFPLMTYTERTDVNKYFECEYDYLHSGYEAKISTKELDMENDSYEVLLRLLGGKKAYRTGTYISKGLLMYANPLEYKPLDVDGTELEKIVENGILRVYRPDCGMYVYQYEGELYWIAETNYEFVNEDTYIQYQLETTQLDRLPEERLENQWYWDNIGFMFSENELLKCENMGEYRVSKKAIPKGYSIKKIWTGNYISDWIWQQSFRPYYKFEDKGGEK